MMGIGIQLHQVVARIDGKVAQTWGPYRDRVEAGRVLAAMDREDADYVSEQAEDGNTVPRAAFTIFSADADFFA